jgi:non-heme chloroperoxidase
MNTNGKPLSPSRRTMLASGLAATTALCLPTAAPAAGRLVRPAVTPQARGQTMGTFKTKDGTDIFYKDWGPRNAQVIAFHHGWPLSSDDWDNQMMFFLAQGYRVVAHDRRGHGRSSQTDVGTDMDTYAADCAELAAHLNLKNAIHVGHSTGGGEVTRYVARYGGGGRVSKAVLISAIPPQIVQTPSNPTGVPRATFDGLRASLAANRSQFYLDVASGPFYGFNRPGVKTIQGCIDSWWRQGMMGAAQAQYDCIKVWSETDLTEDLKMIEVPTLILHSEDDQVVPFANSGPKAAKLLKHATFKAYKDLPHGMPTTHAEIINADIMAFLKA